MGLVLGGDLQECGDFYLEGVWLWRISGGQNNCSTILHL